jgi:hypothetical protein
MTEFIPQIIYEVDSKLGIYGKFLSVEHSSLSLTTHEKGFISQSLGY